MYEIEQKTTDPRKIVFEDKADAALQLGLIDTSRHSVIVKVYSLRNGIHIHAELRRKIQYEIETAKDAYWHLQGFCKRISDKMLKDGKASDPSASVTAKTSSE